MRKFILPLFTFLVFFFAPRTFAADNTTGTAEFASSYDVIYDVDGSGVTTVTEKVSLKNLTSQYYATEFKVTIGATQVSDIKASDPSGPLQTSSEQKDTATTISIKFNQQVAGLGKTLPWTLSFKSKDFAEKVGKVWEVRAPRISSSTNLEAYNFILSVPQSFGQPSLISPTPKSQTISSGRMFLTFDKNQLQSSGISANFGTNQVFDFDLTYHLENNNLVPVLTNIALPPDTSFQDVIYQRMDPKPVNVTVDNDGNYLAWYRLSHGQKIDVKVFGSAKLYTSSKVHDPALDDSLRKKYTEATQYWEKDNPAIMNKLNEILGSSPPQDTSEKAKLIFRYVVNNLKYDSERLKDANIERLGAVTALNNPNSAVCMEFTDLFIALARAAGIPTRELDGYAYTENTTLRPLSLTKDVLHAWPEYWDDRRGWVMVDPTWENTTGGVDYFSKLDLNHFAFVVKGFSSDQPVPAGSYKFDGQDSHDVKVTLSENDFLGKPQIDVQIDTSNPILSAFPDKVRVKVVNTGNAVYPSAPLSVSAGKLALLNGGNQELGLVPPYGSAEFDFPLRTKSFLDSYNDQIAVNIGGKKFTKDVTVKPFVFSTPMVILVGVFITFMVFLYLVILGSRLYLKRAAKDKTKVGK